MTAENARLNEARRATWAASMRPRPMTAENPDQARAHARAPWLQ